MTYAHCTSLILVGAMVSISHFRPPSDATSSNRQDGLSPLLIQVTEPSESSYPQPILLVRWRSQTPDAADQVANVNILLSTDDGATFIQTLLANTPNDGEELVAIPESARERLRIMVAAEDGTAAAVNTRSFSIQSTGRTVFLARHAEKADGNDPSLTDQGKRRAKKLATILATRSVSHVFSTNYKRTRETAQPTAASNKLKLTYYRQLNELKRLIDETPEDATILVIGHSNTVGPTSASLGGTKVSLAEDQFNNLYALDYQSDSKATPKTTFSAFQFSPDPPANEKRDQTNGTATDRKTREVQLLQRIEKIEKRLQQVRERLEKVKQSDR